MEFTTCVYISEKKNRVSAAIDIEICAPDPFFISGISALGVSWSLKWFRIVFHIAGFSKIVLFKTARFITVPGDKPGRIEAYND